MSELLNLYEEAKRLHDRFEGIMLYGNHIHSLLLKRESKKKMLYYKTASVILHDRYLNEQEGEDLDIKIPVVTNIVK